MNRPLWQDGDRKWALVVEGPACAAGNVTSQENFVLERTVKVGDPDVRLIDRVAEHVGVPVSAILECEVWFDSCHHGFYIERLALKKGVREEA